MLELGEINPEFTEPWMKPTEFNDVTWRKMTELWDANSEFQDKSLWMKVFYSMT